MWGIVVATRGKAEGKAVQQLKGLANPRQPKSFVRNMEKHDFFRLDGETDIW